jgi:endo-1,4-beta-mannosidase
MLQSKIKVSDGKFTDNKGNLFFPWGFNYTNPEKIGLIEDSWYDENGWKIIESDFQEMKDLGANIIRIHLQYNKFMKDPETPNMAALEKLLQLTEMAEDKGLYLDITGLAAYRKSEQPEWYDQLNERERWDTHKVFWESIAKTVCHSKAVFAYNLMNEPVVGVGCRVASNCEWLPGKGLGGFYFVQNISKNPDNKFSQTIKEWAGELTQIIRLADKETMITIGFLSLSPIAQFAEDVDYLSAHVYPESGNITAKVDYVEKNQSDVPIIIEETYTLKCNVAELSIFFDEIEGKYDGLMGHYFGKPLDELDGDVLSDQLIKSFLEFFTEKNPNKKRK